MLPSDLLFSLPKDGANKPKKYGLNSRQVRVDEFGRWF